MTIQQMSMEEEIGQSVSGDFFDNKVTEFKAKNSKGKVKEKQDTEVNMVDANKAFAETTKGNIIDNPFDNENTDLIQPSNPATQDLTPEQELINEIKAKLSEENFSGKSEKLVNIKPDKFTESDTILYNEYIFNFKDLFTFKDSGSGLELGKDLLSKRHQFSKKKYLPILQQILHDILGDFETPKTFKDSPNLLNELVIEFYLKSEKIKPLPKFIKTMLNYSEIKHREAKSAEYKEKQEKEEEERRQAELYQQKILDEMDKSLENLYEEAETEGKLIQGLLFPELSVSNRYWKEAYFGDFNSKGKPNKIKFEVVYKDNGRSYLALEKCELSLKELKILAANFQGYMNQVNEKDGK